MDLATHIFREYDIRGIVGKDLDPEVTRLVGRAFGSVLRETVESSPPTIVVGEDNRLHSPMLAQGLMEGLVSAGVDVISIGALTHSYKALDISLEL